MPTSKPLLYHAPMACSLAARIAAAEAGIELDLAFVDLTNKRLEDGRSYLDVNPLGQVSVLQLPNGRLLSETSAVLVWLQANAGPTVTQIPAESNDYYELLRWISFCATELHKQIFRVLFYPEATAEVKERVRTLAPPRFAVLDNHLRGRQYLVGENFSSADAYLVWALQLMDRAQLDPSRYSALHDYHQRHNKRSTVIDLLRSDQQRVNQ